MDSPLTQLQHKLWPGTVYNALAAEFYRDLWEGIPVKDIVIGGPAGLGKLPWITKAQLAQRGDKARVPSTSPCFDTLTSGTTGDPFITKRSEDELRFLSNFFSSKNHEVPRRSRGLTFVAPYHGTQVPISVSPHQHRISIHDTGAFKYALQVLEKLHNDPGVDVRCTFVTGQERVLNAFCLETERLNRTSDFALEFAFSQGSYVTRTVRSRIERTLGCRLIDRFSLSEIFGGATEGLTGQYRFDPHLLVEVCDPRTGKILEKGIGALIITALFPFQQIQPMIRYYTGDLVEVVSLTENMLSPIVRPLGRIEHSVQDSDSGEWLLPASAIYEVMENFKGARRRPMFVDCASNVTDPLSAGRTEFILESVERDVLHVSLIMKRPPDISETEYVGNMAVLRDMILREAPQLAKAVSSGRCIFSCM